MEKNLTKSGNILVKIHFGKIISYIVLIIWIILTIAPLFWMSYSSFKSNEELTKDIYAWPHDLFDNANDEYVVIAPALNVVPDYDAKKDKRERLIIESTTIAPGRIPGCIRPQLIQECASGLKKMC